jgi:hypothetical protein
MDDGYRVWFQEDVAGIGGVGKGVEETVERWGKGVEEEPIPVTKLVGVERQDD